MLFNSGAFALFFIVTCTVYWCVPKKWCAAYLLLASYTFYAYYYPPYTLLILVVSLVNFAGARQVAIHMGRPRKMWLGATIAGNIGLLGICKYDPLLNEMSSVLWPNNGRAVVVGWLVPLGISFFTFEFVHYVVDVYKGAVPIRNVVKFLLFPAFFPTQIAGPIKRFEDFMPQIGRSLALDGARLDEGCYLVARGLFKKMVLADPLAAVVDVGFGTGAGVDGPAAWTVALAFGFQIYYDFSGYTDIGRGCATLLGFDVPENFFGPYAARDITQFWRRWHVTLSNWLRDYVYIPLGGGRRNQYRNLLITFVLGGLWHGAGLTFVVWGLMHGVGLCVHKAFAGFVLRRSFANWRLWDSAPLRVVSSMFLFAYVTIAWVFFRAPDFPTALRLLQAMLGSPQAVVDFFSPLSSLAADPTGGQLAVRITLWSLIMWNVLLPQFLGDPAGKQLVEASMSRGNIAVGRRGRLIVSVAGLAFIVLATLVLAPYPGDRASPVFIYFKF